MTFVSALEQFRSKNPHASWKGGTELAQFDLRVKPEAWSVILDRLLGHRGGHPILERALGQIGESLIPLIDERLKKVRGEKLVPLIRMIGLILQERGKDYYIRYSKNSGSVQDISLRLLSEFFPEDAAKSVIRVASVRMSQDLFVALLNLRTKESFLIAQAAATNKWRYIELDDNVSSDVLDIHIGFAIEQLASSPGLRPPLWPFSPLSPIDALLKKPSPEKLREFLTALLTFPDPTGQRYAAIELYRRGDDAGFPILKKLAFTDVIAARVATEICDLLGLPTYFDWFAEGLSIPPDPTELSREKGYGHIIDRVSVAIENDPRWKVWLDEHSGPLYSYLDSLRLMAQTPESLLEGSEGEVASGLERLAEQKSPAVRNWISARIATKKPISRTEYFSIIEAIRILNHRNDAELIERTIEHFKPTGFAADFAREVLAGLGDNQTD